MRLLIQSAMIFFGTLLAAGLLALGEPPVAARSGADSGVLPLLQGSWPASTVSPAGR